MVGFDRRCKKGRRLSVAVLALLVVLAAGRGQAQGPAGSGQVLVPGASIEKPGDTGVRAHTNIEIFRPNRSRRGAPAASNNPGPGAVAPPSSPVSGSFARPQ